MQLRELVGMPDLKLDVAAARTALDVALTGVFTTDLLLPGRYLEGGELVLSSLMWRRTADDSEIFVRHLINHRVAALAAGTEPGPVPSDLVDACRRHALPLLTVVPEVSFGTITERVLTGLRPSATESDRASVRWRRMVSAVAAGEGAAQLLTETATDIGVPCTLITSTGRVLAGPSPDPETIDRLATGYLGAARLPHVVRGVARARPAWTVVGVGSQGRRIAGWFLAVPSDELSPAARAALGDLADAVDLERARLEQGVRVERRLADRLLTLLDEGSASAPELDVALHASGLPASTPVVVVSATRPAVGPAWPGDSTRDPNRTGARQDEETEVLRAVLEDVLLHVVKAPVVAAGPDGEVVAFMAAGNDDLTALVDSIRQAAGQLARGLARERLCLGVSGLGFGARGTANGSMRGLTEEARQARRVAERSTTPVSVTTRDEVDSHVVLLAGLPDSVRAGYHQRLLGPLLDYDARHRTELMQTLECFLAHSGSWSVAAQKLHLHVNTLRYRVGRIEQLTGRDLNRLEHQVDLFLALRARG